MRSPEKEPKLCFPVPVLPSLRGTRQQSRLGYKWRSGMETDLANCIVVSLFVFSFRKTYTDPCILKYKKQRKQTELLSSPGEFLGSRRFQLLTWPSKGHRAPAAKPLRLRPPEPAASTAKKGIRISGKERRKFSNSGRLLLPRRTAQWLWLPHCSTACCRASAVEIYSAVFIWSTIKTGPK